MQRRFILAAALVWAMAGCGAAPSEYTSTPIFFVAVNGEGANRTVMVRNDKAEVGSSIQVTAGPEKAPLEPAEKMVLVPKENGFQPVSLAVDKPLSLRQREVAVFAAPVGQLDPIIITFQVGGKQQTERHPGRPAAK